MTITHPHTKIEQKVSKKASIDTLKEGSIYIIETGRAYVYVKYEGVSNGKHNFTDITPKPLTYTYKDDPEKFIGIYIPLKSDPKLKLSA